MPGTIRKRRPKSQTPPGFFCHPNREEFHEHQDARHHGKDARTQIGMFNPKKEIEAEDDEEEREE